MKEKEKTTTIGSSIYQKILYDVIHGILPSEQKLKLGDLKNLYQVSVSTIREVLNRLTNDGFIIAEEQKGFYVAPLTKKHFNELAQLRFLLESNMLKLSIKAGDVNWESHIIAAHYRLHKHELKLLEYKNLDFHELQMADFDFHQTILSACDSTELISLHKIIYTKYLRYQINVLGFRRMEAIEEHKLLLEYCLERNAAAATKVLKTHIYEAVKLFKN